MKNIIIEPVLTFKSEAEKERFKQSITRYKEENEAFQSGRAVVEMVNGFYDRVEPLNTNLFGNDSIIEISTNHLLK